MKASPETESAILAIMDQVWKCWSEKRWDDLIQFYVPDPDLRVIGAGAGDMSVGPENVKAQWQSAENKEEKIVSLEYENPQISQSGDVAWFSAGLKVELPSEEGTFNIYLRCSAVYEYRDDRWLIAQMHLSAPLDLRSPSQ